MHLPQEFQHLEMLSPYLFVHFNIQPVGHLIVLQSRREENKANCKSSLCQVSAGNHHRILGRVFYKGWARKESRGQP